jgi:hypothetical protein
MASRIEIGLTVQCKWRRLRPGEKAPDDKALNRWLKQFKEMGSVSKQKSSGNQEHRKRMWSALNSCV